MKTTPAIKDIVILGAGSVATHLAISLHSHGFRIRQIYSRTSNSAQMLAMKTSSEYITDLEFLEKDADLYIVALKDSVIECLIRKLFVSGIVVHTSGSLPMSLLENMSLRYGVFYPLQTFSKSRPIHFDDIPICLEASDSSTLQALHLVAATLSKQIHNIDSAQRRYIHLAAVFSCNFSNFMYVAAADILKSRNIEFDIMLPLIKEFFEKVRLMEPWEAQTGPAIREDKTIIGKQLELLNEFPAYKEIYKQITEKIVERKQLEINN